VVACIDPQLAGPYGRDEYCYTKRPFVESVPEQGYQGERNPSKIYREGIGGLGNFADLSAAERDERLRAIERTPFSDCCVSTPSKAYSATRSTAAAPT
jgi:hypothetical protein